MCEKELTGYVHFKDIEKYQFIFATQSSCSFFCVYAKFNIKGTILVSVDLFLKNYGGPDYKFKNHTIDFISRGEGVLRIRCHFSLNGVSTSSKNTHKLSYDLKDIDHIFFTRDPAHFLDLKNYSALKLKSLSEESNSFDIEEFDQRPVTKKYTALKTAVPFAIGGNCRVSLMQVVNA